MMWCGFSQPCQYALLKVSFFRVAVPFFVSPSIHKVLVSGGKTSPEFVFWPYPVAINTTPEVSVLKNKTLNKCVTLFQCSHSNSQTKHTRSHIIFTFWHATLHSRSERANVQHRLSLKTIGVHADPPMIFMLTPPQWSTGQNSAD